MNTFQKQALGAVLWTLSTLAYAGTAFGEEAQKPAVTFQASPIVINGQADDEALLFQLPKDAPPALTEKKIKIEDLRLRLKAARTKLMELVKSFDFEKLSNNSQTLAQAIEDSKAQVQELEDLENEYLLDRDLHLADAGQATAAKPATTLSH